MDLGIGIDVPYNGETRHPVKKYRDDPAGPAFECARHCHNSTECTHWGVNYETSDTIWCQLKKEVKGKRFNPNFKMAGNRDCTLGTQGAGKDCSGNSAEHVKQLTFEHLSLIHI